VGMFALPRFFNRIAGLGSREVFILAASAVALGTAYAATLFGVSIALGAFVAGMVVARSDISHQVVGEITPLRDIFAALFFVGVGMLFDPALVLQNWPIVLLTALLIIVLKGTLSGLITMFAGYRGRTAVLSGVVLAQSGEFSFLLARLGADLDVVTSEVFGVVVAGSALSIVVLPTLYRFGRPFGAYVERHMPHGRRTRVEQPPLPAARGGHAILCGYGRVGRVIERALVSRGVDYVVVDQDIHAISELRRQGKAAMYGSASNVVLLEQAGIKRARVLVLAIPDPVSARQIVSQARQVNPLLDIVVRTHSDLERRELEGRGADEAVMGELELALEMSRHTLRRFGATDAEAESAVHALRTEL
jgi:monovalent cation:H+ antiporter-2, CPA2 family